MLIDGNNKFLIDIQNFIRHELRISSLIQFKSLYDVDRDGVQNGIGSLQHTPIGLMGKTVEAALRRALFSGQENLDIMYNAALIK